MAAERAHQGVLEIGRSDGRFGIAVGGARKSRGVHDAVIVGIVQRRTALAAAHSGFQVFTAARRAFDG